MSIKLLQKCFFLKTLVILAFGVFYVFDLACHARSLEHQVGAPGHKTLFYHSYQFLEIKGGTLVWINTGCYFKLGVEKSWRKCFNTSPLWVFFRHVIFKHILVIDGWSISCEIALQWMSLDFTDDQSTLVQIMAWCHQAKSHYLSQCWPRSLLPYCITRPQWVKSMVHGSTDDKSISVEVMT